MNSSTSEGFHQPNQQRRCCLVDKNKKCLRPAGTTHFTKKMQSSVNATQKKSRLQLDEFARHYFICDYHKNVVDRLVAKYNKKMLNEETDEEVVIPIGRSSSARSPPPPVSKAAAVDFSVLSASSLKRCKKFLKIQSRPNLNKAQLAEVVQRHFSTVPVNEQEVIDYFIYTVKSSRKQNHLEDHKK